MSPSADLPSPDERELRAERILDAAAELMVAWGHRKTTIDDVARRAGIGKGTVYLHFPTKERLFLTVVLRAQRGIIGRMVQLMRADPEAVRPSEIARNIYLLQSDSPIIRGLFTGDTEALGSLTRNASQLLGDLVEARQKTTGDFWALLTEHGLLSSRIPAEQQYFAYSATVMGHLLSEPLLSQQGYPVPELTDRAELVARSVRLLLEQDPPESAMRAIQSAAVDLFEGLGRLMDDELKEQKRVKRTT